VNDKTMEYEMYSTAKDGKTVKEMETTVARKQ
jgi:hypothetical protein